MNKDIRKVNENNIEKEIYTLDKLKDSASSLAARQDLLVNNKVDWDLLSRLEVENKATEEVYLDIFKNINENQGIIQTEEWLIDNFYIIKDQIKEIKQEMPKKYNRQLLKIAEGDFKGHPRIYEMAYELIKHTDAKIDKDNIKSYIEGYQKVKYLDVGELWAFPFMLRIVLVQCIYDIAKNIRFVQSERKKADEKFNKIIQDIDKKENDYSLLKNYLNNIENESYIYVAKLFHNLKDEGDKRSKEIEYIEQRLKEKDLDLNKVILYSNQNQSKTSMTIGNAITSIKMLGTLSWEKIFEELCIVEKILSEDPSELYSKMDFQSRDRYRHKIEEFAKEAKIKEHDVAKKVLELSRIAMVSDAPKRERHVGFYLLSDGQNKLEKELNYKNSFKKSLSKTVNKYNKFLYIFSIAALTILVVTALTYYGSIYANGNKNLLTLIAILSIIPAADIVVNGINYLITRIKEPYIIPKLDFEKGIPDEFKSIVVIPCLLSNKKTIKNLIDQLEIHYLANSDKNIRFALLGDFIDSKDKIRPEDNDILGSAIKGINELNKKYERDDLFYLFNRYRVWNECENKWMGWERKRGKLLEFNKLLKGSKNTSFDTIVGNLKNCTHIKYVITLDADTKLPRDSARKMIGAMAHPLNRPVFNKEKTKVVDGYGILQPRVAITINSASRSIFSLFFSGEIGIDQYSGAISDVYQDLFKEGIFTGKGIYDVEAFDTVLCEAIPENRVLSHDLLEGCYVRAGLVTDIELADGYPSHYNTYCARLHRWVRGDWQIIYWLFGRVKNKNGVKVKNPINVISKWKIFDNLRRSVLAPWLMLFLIFGLSILPGKKLFWVTFVGMVLVFPVITYLIDTMLSRPHWLSARAKWIARLDDIKTLIIQSVLAFVFLPYQAHLMLSAILKTLGRILFTHKNLLEWESADSAESRLKTDLKTFSKKMWPAQVQVFIIFLIIINIAPKAIFKAIPFILMWAASPYIAYWVSRLNVHKDERLSQEQEHKVRMIGRKTWRYFDEFVCKSDNWLAPDNFQEDPKNGIAHRTSPTNIGLSLIANLAARDMGYISLSTAIYKIENIIATLEKLPRWKGHFYNWYDTQTLEPLRPQYVSTVDSGNLIVYLITVKQGLKEFLSRPLIDFNLVYGLEDNVNLVKEEGFEQKGNLNKIYEYIDESQIDIDGPTTEDGKLNIMPNLIGWERLLSELTYVKESNWSGQLKKAVEDFEGELDNLLPWVRSLKNVSNVFGVDIDDKFDIQKDIKSFVCDLKADTSPNSLLINIKSELTRLENIIENLKHKENSANYRVIMMWMKDFRSDLKNSISNIQKLVMRCDKIIKFIDETVEITDFKSLYDEDKQLFAIGYLLGKERLDLSSYDLLASECRQTSFIAIAKGEVPEKHWFRLSRALTSVGENRALLSWTGTMFEYLMPLLVMKNYKNTLLNETYNSVIKRQIEYGRQRRVPWGISESGFYAMDMNYNYQYKAFGVPGLGYKRGLSSDLVISPYSTVMALLVSPKEAFKNMKRLISDGLEGEYGFYEAIDYTAGRVKKGRRGEIVKSFMVHHEGMSFLAINNYINNNIMQLRFHNEPIVKATEIMLEERVPKRTIITKQHEEEANCTYVRQLEEDPVRRSFSAGNTPLPEAHVLSNGKYSVMITNSGSGYSSYDGIGISRWREDVSMDNWGSYIYIQNLNSMNVWSSCFSPYNEVPEKYECVFFPDRAVYSRTDGNIDTRTEVVVSPEHNVEVRRVSLTNHSDSERTLELTSYFEVVISSMQADMAHPAFGNLFVRTEFLEQSNSILASRRSRSMNERQVWMMHTVSVNGNQVGKIQYETDRAKFIGRARDISNPEAMDINHPLSNTEGAVLDPCISLRARVKVKPGETINVAFSTGAANSREEIINLTSLYSDYKIVDRAIEMAWSHSQIELRYLNIDSKQSNLIQRIVSTVLYLNPLKRLSEESILKNKKGQSNLWAYGISGDTPIVLARIRTSEGINLVRQLLSAHSYWSMKGMCIELVILNEDSSSYIQTLNDMIGNAIAVSRSNNLAGKQGGIFIVQGGVISEEDRNLLVSVARLVFDEEKGSIKTQLEHERVHEKISLPLPIEKISDLKNEQTDTKEEIEFSEEDIPIDENNKVYKLSIEKYAVNLIKSKLKYFNGYGGFSEETGEYTIILNDNKNTPAPWINVISNPKFGFQVSEIGSGYSWSENSRENKITSWNNDPICDQASEILYVRDENSGEVWNLTAGPIREESDYIIRHGQGYSTFEHISRGIRGEQTMFVDINNPVKMCHLKLKNVHQTSRTLSATYYAELVLGVSRSQTIDHVATWIDEESNALFAANGYNEDFPNKITFIYTNGENISFTGDRTEFLGRNGSKKDPKALKHVKLSGRTGAGFDPCGAVQVKFDLEPQAEVSLNFLIGQAGSVEEARKLISLYNDDEEVNASFVNAKTYWNEMLNTVQVETPDASMNILINKWLVYQTLSCRIWARSAFYQSGGAYGFRDQLQDVMALMHSDPNIAREQILKNCAHQFVEGDVQHWWHPGKDKGIRTRFSDDLLWLPYVTAEYIRHTDDWNILNEKIYYLENDLLEEDEDEKYSIPAVSSKIGTVYEHCLKAIEKGMHFGEHGIPLMGSGDWNDGMNRIGNKGKGESVWVGWFLYSVLDKFVPICDKMNENNLSAKFKETMKNLAESIEKNAWDGGWYRRAYFDDGTPLGSVENDECQIDSISQSWGIISGAAKESRVLDAMKAVENYLVKKDTGIVMLLTPAFDKSKLDPGYIKGYVPGVRENGGQYTHAAIWTALAFAKLGMGNKAVELYNMLNPINHSRTLQEALKYKVEPYVMTADVYGVGDYSGKGGWSWYTGAAGWMYTTGLEFILGLKVMGNKLKLEPCVPKEWKEYRIKYKYKNTQYIINIKNTKGVNTGVEAIYLDDEYQKEGYIILKDDNLVHDVKVVMGNENLELFHSEKSV